MFALVADELDRLTVRRVRQWHRLVACCRAASLDNALASGISPEANAYLAARAFQLTSARSRRDLAAGLHRILAAEPGRSPRVAIRRDRVSRAAAELGALPGYLLAPGPVPAQGVAMIRQLLSDGTGPLYRESCRVDLRDAARRAAEALAR
jgi:hypothetical protein